MKKICLLLSALFAVAAFCGVAYVMSSQGRANAGYAVIPMLWCIVFLLWGRARNSKNSPRDERIPAKKESDI